MKINHISISNFCGIENFNAATPAPIIFVAGHNKVGKSSFIEAVNLALTGEFSRVSKKKDFNQLVNNKAEKGAVKVSTSQGDFNINLPTGSGTQMNVEVLNHSLLHGNFTTMTLDDQRRAINALSPTAINAQTISQELANRGFGNAALQLDLTNLPKAVEQAKDYAKQARTAWQTITGETYGSKKAENWQAVAEQVEAVATETVPAGRIEHLQQDIEKAIGEKAQIQAQIDGVAEHNRRITYLKSQISGADTLKRQLKQHENELAETAEQIANLEFVMAHSQQFTCPCCSKPLFLQNGGLVEASDKVIAKLAEHQHTPSANINDLRSRTNYLNQQFGSIKAQLANLDQLQAELDSLGEMRTSEQAVADELNHLARHIISTHTEIERLQAIARQASQAAGGQQQADRQAQQTTANALAQHQAVTAWTTIADLLSPSGDIGKLLSQSVQAFNDVLADVETMIGWQSVKFDYDNGMTYDNRPYHLLSESEQWRVDTAISYVFSQLADTRIFAIDRFDVLDLPSRLPVMKWLNGLAELGTVDTVIMAGTMKETPKTPPTFNVFWLGENHG